MHVLVSVYKIQMSLIVGIKTMVLLDVMVCAHTLIERASSLESNLSFKHGINRSTKLICIDCQENIQLF